MGEGIIVVYGVAMIVGAILTIPLLRSAERHQRMWRAWLRWPYLGLKWFLVFIGVMGTIGLIIEETKEGRVGLGTGILTMVILATVKGVTNAITSHMPGSPAGHQDPPPVH